MGRGFWAVIAVMILTFCGCGTKQPVDKVTSVAADDPKMNAAIHKARSTVQNFIAALQSPKAGQGDFSVKKEFTESGTSEHIWLNPVSFDGTRFTGTVNNDPQLKSVKIGQQATVARDEISDWMYVENGKLVGGETLRVLRESLTPAERVEFDKEVPFTID